MAFILGAGLLLALAGFAVGWIIGKFSRRTTPAVRLSVHLALLALSLVPIALHVWYSARFAASFGAPAIDPVGLVPQLRSAMIGGFSLIAVSFLVGAIASRYAAALAAAVPAAAFTAYYVFVLPAFGNGPVLVPLDNMPIVWLFLYEGAFCVVLATHAIVGRIGQTAASGATTIADQPIR